MKILRSFLFFLLLIFLPSCGGWGFGLPDGSSAETILPTVSPQPTAVYSDLPDSQLFDLPWDDRSLFLNGLTQESQHWASDLPQASL